MKVKYPCLVCKKAVANNHKAVHCDMCSKWVHIKCNKINSTTYQNLQEDNSDWYCVECLKKILPFMTEDDNKINNIIYKAPRSLIDHTPECDKEKECGCVSSNYYTPLDFSSLGLNNKSYDTYIHMNIASLSYHNDDLFNFLSNIQLLPKVIGISETNLISSKKNTHQHFFTQL